MTRPRRLPRSEAEPCPFCGEQPRGQQSFNSYTVFCQRCNVDMWAHLKSSTLDNWNTRRAPAEKGKR